jgi:Peptidase M60, enhancin and enhancin-like/N-terminal domain of M60-like peptidases
LSSRGRIVKAKYTNLCFDRPNEAIVSRSLSVPHSPMHFRLAFSFLCIAHLSLAQTPGDWQRIEREIFFTDLTAVPKIGAPSPIAIWGNMAFPVIAAGATGKPEQALAAAAGYGRGRAMIFGQNGYLSGKGKDGAQLIQNAIKWSTGGKAKPRVGLKGVKFSAELSAFGHRTETIDGALTSQSMRGFDVVIANVQGVTSAEEGEAVMQFIKQGGGFIAGMTGWAFEQTSGGQSMAAGHLFNHCLMPLGIAFTDESGFNGVNEFQARATLPPMLNAFEAISAIAKQSKGPAMTSEDFNQAADAIQIAMAAQPPGRSTLQSAVLSALGSAKQSIPTAQAPLMQVSDGAARIRLSMETRIAKMATGTLPAHASAATFPGVASDKAARVTKQVAINPAINGWTSTGLWMDAGDTVTVTVPKDVANNGYSVRVGSHTDTLYHLDKWSRAPEISRSVSITTIETEVGSAFGGLIYIDVPSKAANMPGFSVSVANAIEAPFFTLGVDDDAKWNSSLKLRPAPWAEFACGKVILCCPSEAARTVNNPTQLMQFWTAVVDAQDEISNQAKSRTRPERIVADIQISAGYMHSGYPIMVPTSASLEMVTLTRLKFPGWGYYHELGHNHQRREFTFEGTGEVTNNVLGLWVYVSVLKKDMLIGHTEITLERRKQHIADIKKANDKWTTWKKDPFLALTTYIQLVEGFGWEAWRTYLHSFEDPSYGPPPSNDAEARDQFLIRYSKITKSNLGPFFGFWGIDVSSLAKESISNLPTWMPKEL